MMHVRTQTPSYACILQSLFFLHYSEMPVLKKKKKDLNKLQIICLIYVIFKNIAKLSK